MGRPIKKSNFGSNGIRVSFHNGTSVVTGYIVKQLGSRRFKVTDGTTTMICILASTLSSAQILTKGLCTIQVVSGQTTSYVKTLNSRQAITMTGEKLIWAATGTTTLVKGDGVAPGQMVGGLTVGAPGSAGSLYEGYTLAWADDFDTLDVLAPGNPRGRYFTTRTYLTGPRGSDTILGPQYNADPFHVGFNDRNRGNAIGYDNMGVSGSALRLQARLATAPERTHFQGTGRYALASMICSTGVVAFHPDAKGAGDIVVEARIKHSTTNPTGWHPTFWTQSDEPTSVDNSQSGDEHDFEGTYLQANLHHNLWGGLPGSNSAGGEFFNYDNAYHLWTFVLSKSTTDGVKLYKDGVLFATGAYNANLSDKLARFLLTSHVDSDGTEAGWTSDADGARMDVDYVRVWNRTSKPRFTPLQSVTDVNIAFGGSTTITLPSLTALWGPNAVSDYVQAVMAEENEPGGVHSTPGYIQFPAGVTYNSTTRVITIAPTSAKAGRINFVVKARAPGCVSGALRFAANVGPKINAATIPLAASATGTFDLYAVCDCGVLVSNAAGFRTKTISVTGLPGWATYNDATGLISYTAPGTNSATTLTVTVTNSLGQTATATINLTVTATVTSFSDDFNRSNQTLETSTNWTRLDGSAGAITVANNATSVVISDTAGAAYVSPDLGSANHFIDVKFLSASGQFAAVRITDRSNFLGFRRNAGDAIEVYSRIGGTLAVVSPTSGAYGTGVAADVMRLSVNGSTFNISKNGTVVATGTIPGGVPSSTRCGLIGRASGGLVDDFASGLS